LTQSKYASHDYFWTIAATVTAITSAKINFSNCIDHKVL